VVSARGRRQSAPTTGTSENRRVDAMVITARQLMTSERTCTQMTDTVRSAASTMRRLGVGALPICGQDNQLQGVITDRDIVTGVVAVDRDPDAVTVGELAQREAVTIGADDTAQIIFETMSRHRVRRLPVIEGTELVGIVALADVAKALPETAVGQLLAALSAD
jgi:CBS domain-containing protein